MKTTLESFEQLIHIMDELREKCPWDRKQTFETIRNLTIEETYELADAIIEEDYDDVKKELGDLLLHIVFYSKMGDEKALFNLKDVIDGINEKLVFRHPHVFSDTDVHDDANQVVQNWEELKKKEGNKTVLGGVPESLPALIKANRIQEKVRAVGFDWDQREQVWDKVDEEIGELKQEIRDMDQNKAEQEFGDLFFSLVNAARLYGIDPELALERTNKKFKNRFNHLEQAIRSKGQSLRDMDLKEMDALWEEAKQFDQK